LPFQLAAELARHIASALGSQVVHIGFFDDDNYGSRGSATDGGIGVWIPRCARLRNLLEETTLPLATFNARGIYSGWTHRRLQRAALRIAVSWLKERQWPLD
jgi:hypothetical protein